MLKIENDYELSKLKDLGFIEECYFYSLLVEEEKKEWKLEISVDSSTREVLIYGTIDSREVYDIIGNMPDIIYDMIKNDIIIKGN